MKRSPRCTTAHGRGAPVRAEFWMLSCCWNSSSLLGPIAVQHFRLARKHASTHKNGRAIRHRPPSEQPFRAVVSIALVVSDYPLAAPAWQPDYSTFNSPEISSPSPGNSTGGTGRGAIGGSTTHMSPISASPMTVFGGESRNQLSMVDAPELPH